MHGPNDILKISRIENNDHFHWLDENLPIAIVFQKSIYFKEDKFSYVMGERTLKLFVELEKNETAKFTCIKIDRLNNIPHLTRRVQEW